MSRRTLCACATVAALSAACPVAANATSLSAAQAHIAKAMKSASTAGCTSPALTEPFTSFGDANEYALVPGESADSFTGSGWTLLGGASITTTMLDDGTSASVLDLPDGSIAVSPAACVTSSYTSARMMVRNLASSAGASMYVSYLSATPSLTSVGAIAGAGTSTTWSPSSIVSIDPTSATGWQLVWFTFSGSGGRGDSQLYDLYVDPRMKY